jgi:hypothetical protein
MVLQSPVQSFRWKNLDFPLCTIPTVSPFKKYGVFRKHHTSRKEGLVFFARGQICPDLFVSVFFGGSRGQKAGKKKMVRAKAGKKKDW